jgi:hypothetical protein
MAPRYSITVAARDGKIYTIKNGELMDSVIQLESQPVGLVTMNKNIIVGCMNDVVHSYKSKGVKNWTLYMPASIIAIQSLNVTAARMTKCIIVALSNCEQHGTAWHSMAQHGTAWHSMAQHGTAWHSTRCCFDMKVVRSFSATHLPIL